MDTKAQAKRKVCQGCKGLNHLLELDEFADKCSNGKLDYFYGQRSDEFEPAILSSRAVALKNTTFVATRA
jgi:hypothetical protein